MLPRMKINVSTLTWKDPENYTTSSKRIYRGQDYHILQWNNRIMDLEDLEADEGHVLTGRRVSLNKSLAFSNIQFQECALRNLHHQI